MVEIDISHSETCIYNPRNWIRYGLRNINLDVLHEIAYQSHLIPLNFIYFSEGQTYLKPLVPFE